MMRVTGAILVLLVSGHLAAAQTPAKPKTPGEIAKASEKLAEKREACRKEAAAQKLSFNERRKYRQACLKR